MLQARAWKHFPFLTLLSDEFMSLLFLLHLFPMSPFTVLWGAVVGGELLKAPGCCSSSLREKGGKSQ